MDALQRCGFARSGRVASFQVVLLVWAALAACERDRGVATAGKSATDPASDAGVHWGLDAGKRPSTPEELFRLQWALLRAADAEKLWALFTDHAKRQCEAYLDAVRKGAFVRPENVPKLSALSAMEICVFPLYEDRSTRFRTPRIRLVERPQPDTAIVCYGEGYGWTRQRFTRVAGVWKIDQYIGAIAVPFPLPHPIKVRLPDGRPRKQSDETPKKDRGAAEQAPGPVPGATRSDR